MSRSTLLLKLKISYLCSRVPRHYTLTIITTYDPINGTSRFAGHVLAVYVNTLLLFIKLLTEAVQWCLHQEEGTTHRAHEMLSSGLNCAASGNSASDSRSEGQKFEAEPHARKAAKMSTPRSFDPQTIILALKKDKFPFHSSEYYPEMMNQRGKNHLSCTWLHVLFLRRLAPINSIFTSNVTTRD